jgi:hypothetical protein
MKVKCIAENLGAIKYRITQGKEYVVLGLSYTLGNPNINFWIKDDPGNYFVPTPRSLFEIVDPRASCYWVVNINIDGSMFVLAPEEFLEPLFLDRLTNLEEKYVRVFQTIAENIERESSSSKH